MSTMPTSSSSNSHDRVSLASVGARLVSELVYGRRLRDQRDLSEDAGSEPVLERSGQVAGHTGRRQQ
jgi:hypothetical protein